MYEMDKGQGRNPYFLYGSSESGLVTLLPIGPIFHYRRVLFLFHENMSAKLHCFLGKSSRICVFLMVQSYVVRALRLRSLGLA